MSTSSLWVMGKEFNGEELLEFQNSWLFTPVSWDILLNKYMPTHNGEKRNFIAATMFDKDLSNELNRKINNSEIQADRVLWELGNQQIFFTKDKEFIASSIKSFLEVNKEYALDLPEHIHERFNEVANEILKIDDNESPYLIFKNSSCDDGIEYWFSKYNDETEDNEDVTLDKFEGFAAEFVTIKDNKIFSFISNVDFFGGNEESQC
ncbi:hypothetical protein [Clostridium estertheticum]|uniref:hypothetical protein n=1 Tax=Clostridium estertheticum TaxID=238834 RepID=UPI001C7E0B52|nr:hypothetical protein [Clostridium estertheticum]MBX4266592.1 hypothetical protein [Clostridium estertheticum]WLC88070.1 hypothetical protein KTC95_18935 [Clostridium estertheticum]